MKIFDLDSPLMRFLGRVADLMIVNLLIIICCLPIFTIGPALTAGHYVCLKMVRHEETYIIKNFFKSFKDNFKQGTLIWLILLVAILIVAGDYYVIVKSGMEFHKVFKIFLIVAGAILGLICLFIFPVLAKFDNTIRATFRNAFIMSLVQLPKGVLMVVLYLAPWLIMEMYMQIVPVVLMLGISVPMFLSAMLYNKFFQKIEDNVLAEQEASAEPEEVEDDPDRIFSDKLDESLVEQNTNEAMIPGNKEN